MTTVNIYKPAKTAMQSGQFKTLDWVMEFERQSALHPEPLMGWISSGDMQTQVAIRFKTLEQALRFVGEQGWDYCLKQPHAPLLRPKSYADNFIKQREG